MPDRILPRLFFSHFLLETVLQQTGQTDLPVKKTWRLNERHYGALTGLNKGN